MRKSLSMKRARLIQTLKAKDEDVKNKTIHFWNLQLQFMVLDRFSLGCIALYYIGNGAYKLNEYTRKMKALSDKARWSELKFTQDEHDCLATHLALQLSGLA